MKDICNGQPMFDKVKRARKRARYRRRVSVYSYHPADSGDIGGDIDGETALICHARRIGQKEASFLARVLEVQGERVLTRIELD